LKYGNQISNPAGQQASREEEKTEKKRD